MADGIVVKDLNAWFGAQQVVKHVSMDVPRNAVTAVIGPSGCGKSTFIRCLNRMHEIVRGARVTGEVLLDGEDLYAAGVDPVTVRRRIGMVFQRPNPFPTMSVFDNVAAGLTLNGVRDRAVPDPRAQPGAHGWSSPTACHRRGGSPDGRRICSSASWWSSGRPGSSSPVPAIAGPRTTSRAASSREDAMPRHVDRELTSLERMVLRMGEAVQDQLRHAMEALVRGDEAGARHVIDGDRGVNAQDVEIDEKCVEVLALYEPAASDLRLVTTVMKIVTDLERVGDQAVNIAQRVLELSGEPPAEPPLELLRMADRAAGMLKESLQAFIARDTARARRVCAADDEVDELKERLFRELLDAMRADPEAIPRAMRLVLISRYLERVADHATNIAEMVIYMVESTMVRHTLA